MSEAARDGGPLADIRVLDLAGESGVFAGRVLGEMGADVIRIEPPGGDGLRRRRPFLDDIDGPERSLYHLHYNANKRGVTLDFRSREGADLLRRLAASADAIIETAAPGEMDGLDLGCDALRRVNPRLLYGTITPFGQQGPMKDYRGPDLVGVAMSGVMWLNGDQDDPPNQPGAEQAYHMAALALVTGLTIGVCGRDRRPGGEGYRIDVSIQEAAAMSTLQTANPNVYTWYDRVPARRGTGVFGGRHLQRCADGQWVSFVIMPYRWDELIRWLDEEGIEHEMHGPEWRDQAFRQQNPGLSARHIQALAQKYERPALFHEGQKRLISVMPVNDVKDLVEDAQLAARDFFTTYEHPATGRSLTDMGPAAKLSASPLRFRRPAPRLAEHNDEIFGGLLGLGADELAGLRGAAII